MSKNLPKSTKVVVVGGEFIGCSVAYHLTKFGYKNVVLLERDSYGLCYNNIFNNFNEKKKISIKFCRKIS